MVVLPVSKRTAILGASVVAMIAVAVAFAFAFHQRRKPAVEFIVDFRRSNLRYGILMADHHGKGDRNYSSRLWLVKPDGREEVSTASGTYSSERYLVFGLPPLGETVTSGASSTHKSVHLEHFEFVGPVTKKVVLSKSDSIEVTRLKVGQDEYPIVMEVEFQD
jgi:hypothetical protein